MEWTNTWNGLENTPENRPEIETVYFIVQ